MATESSGSQPRVPPRCISTVLVAHNYYRHPGGEDRVFESECDLLEQHGHVVVRYQEHNTRIRNDLAAGIASTWNPSCSSCLRELVRSAKPLVAHFHNTFPLISPSGYSAVRSLGLPVVQTLHNYRLICPGATLFRDGNVCEECLGRKSFAPAVVHGCYRDSRPATAGVAAMLTVHRAKGTWQRMIDVYVALSEFARRKFIQGGLPPDRIIVKPNFVACDPGVGDGGGGYALFVGRLAEEKGAKVLPQAWQHLADMPLLAAGDGPLRTLQWPDHVKRLGSVPHKKVLELMRGARILVFPSLWYECAPMTIIEAFACGLPVIAPNLGSMPEFVTHARTGLLFRPGDPEDLARQVRWAFDHPEQLLAMRAAARREYEDKYTPERNYTMLMDVYEMALESARRRAAS